MDMGVFLACISVDHVCAIPNETKEYVGSPRTTATDGSELLNMCQEFNWGPLKGQMVLSPAEHLSRFGVFILCKL